MKEKNRIMQRHDRVLKWKTSVFAYAMILPAFVILCLFTLYPIATSFYNSLFQNNLSTKVAFFIGIENYSNLLSDSVFITTFKNNLLIAFVTVPVSIMLGVFMAVYTNNLRFIKGFARMSFFYPVILPMVAAANIWLFIYTPSYGLLGYFNSSWRFLTNPDTAIWAIIVMLIWKQAGYLMIFYISGLQGIPGELYEAARIDGANAYEIFLKITWPLLRPTMIYVTILALTNAYKAVDHLYIMTKGGPNYSTNMLLYYIFQVGFEFWDIGRASAMTIVLVMLLLIVTCVQFFVQDRRTYYS